VTYKTAWRMFHQIRKLLQEDIGQLSGSVEMDETYMGGVRKYGTGRPMRGATRLRWHPVHAEPLQPSADQACRPSLRRWRYPHQFGRGLLEFNQGWTQRRLPCREPNVFAELLERVLVPLQSPFRHKSDVPYVFEADRLSSRSLK
jgi:hypothetical protein